jgi:hypothetical protein
MDARLGFSFSCHKILDKEVKDMKKMLTTEEDEMESFKEKEKD